jgi:hypothetical protein
MPPHILEVFPPLIWPNSQVYKNLPGPGPNLEAAVVIVSVSK